MSHDRANWDEQTTSVFLDIVAKQKELCHWANKCPTSIGWTNIWRSFNEITNLGYQKKQLQNKFNDLKRAYFNWRDGCCHTGLGRDPDTGEVAADTVWYAAVHGEQSQPGEKYKRPSCCDQLFALFGHTPRDRGELVSAGGHGTDQTCSGGSPRTPQDLSDSPLEPRSGGQSSKRCIREHSVDSPIKKKTPSLDDCLEDISHIIRESRDQKARLTTEAEEMATVNKILKEDGFNESDLFFAQALNVCTNRTRRRAFLDLETKQGRINYVKVTWEVLPKFT
ncbi:hypothetical protein HU200_053645 [Digitaria exilis]|uniref:Myb/SANT-like domain-containing protein n=1 Tax=Digitaria exilis TaxID=1010633 RepID=A0A835E508_9POAL|nr:hypothetical protein HU200_053645 [Digitaria exilis]